MSNNYISSTVTRCQDVIDLIFDLTGGEGFIAGGFARYCTSRKDSPVVPNDIDLFCGDAEAFERIVQRVRQHPSTVKKSESPIEIKYEYRLAQGFHKDSYTLQIIKPSAVLNMVADGDYTRVLENFDFTIAKCAILPTGEAIVHANFHLHDEEDKLVITNIHCPISSMKRVLKYAKRGYSVESAELLKLFKDYETRSPEWKDLVSRGLSAADLASWSEEDRLKFTNAMYLD
jgi:hypothetical protein